MGKEKAPRIQTSLLNKVEKNILFWLAEHMPEWVTSDMLTALGFFAAVAYAVFCWLANYNVEYLWLSSFCLVLNWFGDALDGTLARVRKLQRPKYGFFLDHSVDAITTCLFCIGLGLTPYMDMTIALFIMIGYLSLSLFTYLSTMVFTEFPLTYARLGPTEVRLILIAVSILYIYYPFSSWHLNVLGLFLSAYDLMGIIAAATLATLYLSSIIKGIRRLKNNQNIQESNEDAESKTAKESI